MEYKLKTFQIQLTVSRIANIHYFEFTHNYNTKDDRHAFCELVYVDSGSLHIRAENFSGTLRIKSRSAPDGSKAMTIVPSSTT